MSVRLPGPAKWSIGFYCFDEGNGYAGKGGDLVDGEFCVCQEAPYNIFNIFSGLFFCFLHFKLGQLFKNVHSMMFAGDFIKLLGKDNTGTFFPGIFCPYVPGLRRARVSILLFHPCEKLLPACRQALFAELYLAPDTFH